MKKTKLILFSIIVASLLIGTFIKVYAQEGVITVLDYPETVAQDETFKIEVSFEYVGDYCLDGKYILLYYSINGRTMDWSTQILVNIKVLNSYPKVSSVSFKINTTEYDLKANDTFEFLIKYKQGELKNDIIYSRGEVLSDIHKIIITNPSSIPLHFTTVILSLFLIACLFYVKKSSKKIKEVMK